MSQCESLSGRAALAQRLIRRCTLCEHRCGVDRSAGQYGVCGADDVARVWRYWVDYAEEQPLVPSLLIYLSGCDLRCDFCISEAAAFDARVGVPLTTDWLNRTIAWGLEQGARTLQWLGGEPTIHVAAILSALAGSDSTLPVVWKSDFYGTADAWRMLAGVVDTYVADFKFGNDACARRIAGVDHYVEVVTRNLQRVAHQHTLYVRHLLLPGHGECCLRPILAWLRHHLPQVPLSLRTGYLPRWRAGRHAELAHPLERDEGERARQMAAEYRLTLID